MMLVISKTRRDSVRSEVFRAIADMVPEVVRELEQELLDDPCPILSDEDRAFFLLVRETEKICASARLKQDGNREKRIREAVGAECGFCGEQMLEKAEIGLDHTAYDGRPPRPVHRSCHKKHQPH
jgi:hypothetical protein